MTDRITLADIAGALNVSKAAISQRATREAWTYTEESVRGGQRRRYPVATLPAPIRAAVLARRTNTMISSDTAQAVSLPAANDRSPAGLSIPCADLTDAQRMERDARNGVRVAIGRLQASGASQEAAITTLLTSARAGQLDPSLDKMLRLARDKRGRAGDGYPSVRTLKRWLAARDLTPKLPQADMRVPAWAKDFLALWQVPQKPSVDAAYRTFAETWPGVSIHQVRRFVAKLGTVTRERGRMGTRELKNIQPFIRRDFSHLEPNDIWTADGHTFDAEVQHPLHGRPFRPEITAIIDVATRRAVGWSIDLAESSLAVLDALRYGVERNGVPAIFYVDNGSGYKNALIQGEGTGLMGRLGTTISHSLPYNSQARGVIERSHQTIWVKAAKQLPSYIGAAMDREARLEQFKLTRKALKNGAGLTKAMPLIPWDVFVEFIEARIAEYNARPHRTLKGVSPDLTLRAFLAKGWIAETAAADTLATLFRPRVTRTVQRGEIALFTNIYFARELAEFHGSAAQIAYDIHNPSKVWVYTPEGRLICEAEANGNRRHYMPVPVVQQARERRAKGRLQRVDAKREEILEELHGSPAIAAPSSAQIVIGGRVIDTAALSSIEMSIAVPVSSADQAVSPIGQIVSPIATPLSRTDRDPADNYADWLDIDARMARSEPVSESEANWHRSYQTTGQFRVQAKKRAAA